MVGQLAKQPRRELTPPVPTTRKRNAAFQAYAKSAENRSTPPSTTTSTRKNCSQAEALWRYIAVITEETAIGLNRMVLSELIRDLDRSRKFLTETETHDYPMTRLIGEAMDAGVIRKADPTFATNQLLALVKTFSSGQSFSSARTRHQKTYWTIASLCFWRTTKQTFDRSSRTAGKSA